MTDTPPTELRDLPSCPKCESEYTYPIDPLLVCPECGYECWPPRWVRMSASPWVGMRP